LVSHSKGRTRICGPKREEIAGDWRRLHNEELHGFYSSSHIITVINQEDAMSGTCSTQGRYEKFLKILVGKPEGKRPVGRPKRRWEYIKMHLQ
jgi:hypothetical protein